MRIIGTFDLFFIFKKNKQRKMEEKIPPHIQYSIKCEEELIELRLKQIERCKERIGLFKKGMRPSEVFELKPPYKASKKIFDSQTYLRLKREHIREQNILLYNTKKQDKTQNG